MHIMSKWRSNKPFGPWPVSRKNILLFKKKKKTGFYPPASTLNLTASPVCLKVSRTPNRMPVVCCNYIFYFIFFYCYSHVNWDTHLRRSISLILLRRSSPAIKVTLCSRTVGRGGEVKKREDVMNGHSWAGQIPAGLFLIQYNRRWVNWSECVCVFFFLLDLSLNEYLNDRKLSDITNIALTSNYTIK